MSLSQGIDNLAAAIEREENVNPAYNNPGAITTNGVLNKYATPQEGQSALENLLNNALSGNSKYYSPNMSIEQFEQTYTGGDQNAGSNVASFLGVSPTTPISQVATPGAPSSSANSTPSYAQQFLAAANDMFGPSIFGKTIGPSVSDPNAKFSIPSVTDIVLIVAGLVLLAGAVFGFRSLTTTVIEGGKRGAELAAL